VATAEATIQADRAAVERVRLQLEYSTIRSPIDGRTGSLMVHEGNLVKANDKDSVLVVINQLTPIYVTFAVPEQELPAVQRHLAAGQLSVEAAIPQSAEPPEQGVLSFVDNTVDRATGTIRLKATFANPDRRLWPGQFVNVVLTLAAQPDAIVVPSQAVQTGQNGTYVYVVRADRTAEVRPVVVARQREGEAVIQQGLQPGETVVTDGQLRLTSGSQVEVKGSGPRAEETRP
jgi:multidrug efflux system membrane fusion protein